MKKDQHVAPNPRGGWSVRHTGAARATRVFETQKAAMILRGGSQGRRAVNSTFIAGTAPLRKGIATATILFPLGPNGSGPGWTPFEVVFQEAIERILELPPAAPLGEDLQAEGDLEHRHRRRPDRLRRLIVEPCDHDRLDVPAHQRGRTFVSRTITSRTLRAGPPRRAAPADPHRGRSRRSGPGCGCRAASLPRSRLFRVAEDLTHLLLRAAPMAPCPPLQPCFDIIFEYSEPATGPSRPPARAISRYRRSCPVSSPIEPLRSRASCRHT